MRSALADLTIITKMEFDCRQYAVLDEISCACGITLEHWNYGPHRAWTKVGDDTIIRMWQPYNGFEVFKPGSWIDGIADPSVLAV